MRSISGESRRATQDLDLDFIRYSISDDTLRNVSNMEEIIKRIERTFSNPVYLRELNRSGTNWLDISTDEALETALEFIRNIHF